MHRKARERHEEKEWRKLKKWLKASQAERAKLALRADASDRLADWEFERSTLEWAIRTTPATTVLGLQVKAMALQASSPRPCEIVLAGLRPAQIELAEQIVRGVLEMRKAA
jgi:hypothetical protein